MEEIIIEVDEPAEVTPRQVFLAELRHLLDILEANPELPLPYEVGESPWNALRWYPQTPAEAAKLVKALGGRWEKNDPKSSEFDATHLVMKAQLGRELHVRVTVSREGICEKKVVGKETKKVTKVVQPQVTQEVYEEVDVVEFECKSLLSLADQATMAELEAVAS